MASQGYVQQRLPQPPSGSQYEEHTQYQQQQYSPNQPFPPPQQYESRPPVSQQQRKERSFSFQSHKSQKSAGSKQDLQETPGEKESRRLHSKADPTLAMNEAEPAAVAAMKSESIHPPLRSLAHKDPWGNPIADPDLSNPTRSRWERPLDTIRSFEAAIDGGYSRKSMMQRSQADSVANWNKRSSQMLAPQPRFPQESYYGSRPVSAMRPESHYGVATPGYRGSYHENQGHNGYSSRQRPQRSHTDLQPYGGQNPYPFPHKDRSYETVTSAAASGSSADPTGYHTDPTSSDNSSIVVERRSPAKRQEPVNDYGIGFSQPQYYQQNTLSFGAPTANGSHPLPPPPIEHQIPRRLPAVPRREVPSAMQRQDSHPRPAAPEKRKSWLARKFSKSS